MSKSVKLCLECKKPYFSSSALRKHKVKNHGYEPILKITCSLCEYKAKTRTDLIEHLTLSHEYINIEQNLTFMSEKEFTNWKEATETESNSFFVSDSSRSSTIKYFYCNRSGVYEPHPIGSGKINGYRKMGSMCPARIKYKFDSGIFNVNYISSHFGHVCESKHLNIQPSAEEFVVKQIKARVTRQNILLNIKDQNISKQENKPFEFDRFSLITMKDLDNISIRNNLLHSERLHDDDFISAQMKIDKLKKEGSVLLYQNDTKFILALMSEQQLNLLKQFGSDGIMVDSTFGTNKYNLKLTMLLIRDENLYGFPVCLILSDNLETSTFISVFSKLKEKLGMPIKVRFIMSDMATQYSKAWQNVMGEVDCCLFCIFHVRKCWSEHYKRIHSPYKEEISEKLLSLLTERNIEHFEDQLKDFDIYLKQDESNKELIKFHSYFFDFYSERKKKWAYCFRAGCEINTNNHTEAQNRKLKESYTDQNIRLDNCIDQLTKYIEDIHYQRLKEMRKASIGSKLREIHQLHKKAIDYLKFPKLEIQIQQDTKNCTYKVKIGQSHEVFTVTILGKCNHPCRQLCCELCNACLRCFHCNCIQRDLKMNICVHIHLVCLSKNNDLDNELPILDQPDLKKIREIHEEAVFKEKKNFSNEIAQENIEENSQTRDVMAKLLLTKASKRKKTNEDTFDKNRKQRRFNNKENKDKLKPNTI